jgi:hypothetical protein
MVIITALFIYKYNTIEVPIATNVLFLFFWIFLSFKIKTSAMSFGSDSVFVIEL